MTWNAWLARMPVTPREAVPLSVGEEGQVSFCDSPVRLHVARLASQLSVVLMVIAAGVSAAAASAAMIEVSAVSASTDSRPTEMVSPAPEVNPEPVVWRTPTPPANPQAGDVWVNPKDSAEMVYVPAGEFLLGTSEAQIEAWMQEHPEDHRDQFKNEQPQCRVALPAYWIDKYPVTIGQYRQFCQETGRRPPEETVAGGRDNCPMDDMAWQDAVDYARWSGRRLPTELEWEKAARGIDGRIFPWGNEWDPGKCGNSSNSGGGPKPVGSYPSGASPYGVIDMAGTVLQWCGDWYDEKAYDRYAKGDLTPPAGGAERVLRCPSWDNGAYPRSFRAAARGSFEPGPQVSNTGFRCARGPAGTTSVPQGPPPGSISGRVFDSHGQPLSGVRIYPVAKPERFTPSGPHGNYLLPEVGAGGATRARGGERRNVSVMYAKDGKPYDPGCRDLPVDHWAYKEIGAVLHAGIMPAHSDRSGKRLFRPEGSMTRAELAQTLSRVLKLKPLRPAKPTFSDVPKSHPAYGAIEALARSQSLPPGLRSRFSPGRSITRADVMAFFFRALGFVPSSLANTDFSDVPKDYWAWPEIYAVAYRELYDLMPDVNYHGDSRQPASFHPEKPVTRAQLAVYLVKAFKSIKLTEKGYGPRTVHYYIGPEDHAVSDIYLTPCGDVGEVVGVAKAAGGKPISGARVSISLRPVRDDSWDRVTDAKGRFHFYNIPSGSYGYYVFDERSPGAYRTPGWENMVIVHAGAVTQLNLSGLLPPEPNRRGRRTR